MLFVPDEVLCLKSPSPAATQKLLKSDSFSPKFEEFSLRDPKIHKTSNIKNVHFQDFTQMYYFVYTNQLLMLACLELTC